MPEQHPYLLIDQAVAVGAGQSVRLPVVTNDHFVEVYFIDANASISVLIVDLEISLDRPEINDATAKWYVLDSHTLSGAELTAKQAGYAVLNAPAQRIRACIKTLTGGDGSTDIVTVRSIHRYMGRP